MKFYTELPVYEQRRLEAKRRRQTREHVAKHRASKKQKNEVPKSPQTPPFKSAQALGRAVSRARRALSPFLPSTPKRKHAVWQKRDHTMVTIQIHQVQKIHQLVQL